jgi:hypothetical protein
MCLDLLWLVCCCGVSVLKALATIFSRLWPFRTPDENTKTRFVRLFPYRERKLGRSRQINTKIQNITTIRRQDINTRLTTNLPKFGYIQCCHGSRTYFISTFDFVHLILNATRVHCHHRGLRSLQLVRPEASPRRLGGLLIEAPRGGGGRGAPLW